MPPRGLQDGVGETSPTPRRRICRRSIARWRIERSMCWIYNTQTEGSVPEQICTAAEAAGVPVVEVTETVPPGNDVVPRHGRSRNSPRWRRRSVSYVSPSPLVPALIFDDVSGAWRHSDLV